MPSPTPVTAAPTQLFQYRACVTADYDGDTCTADIDLGLGIWVRGADEAKGRAARDHLKTLVDGRDTLVAAGHAQHHEY